MAFIAGEATMLELKTYQRAALDKLADYLRVASIEGAKHAFIEIADRPYHSVPQLPELPYVCLRIPTGGGKTLMACHAVSIATQELLHQEKGVVLWLVPTNAIKDQTLNALRNHKHPYRQALESTLGNRVTVMSLSDALSVQRAALDGSTTIIVSTLAASRVEETDSRKIYEQNGSLMSHFENLPAAVLARLDKYENSDKPIPSLANVFKSRRPIIIVDEAHNARTDLSFDTLARFSPACILEFTATPKQDSNVLYHVSAYELKAADMIKLPIRLELNADWKGALLAARAQRDDLEKLANAERNSTGEYIRPIVLVQAQPRRQNQETLSVDVVKEALTDLGIDVEQIAIETGDAREVKEWEEEHKRTLFDDTCPIRYIITVDKLREGWDCPFAYVLCSVREQSGSTAVEQILGRVLRMPKATRKENDALNYAYAFITSTRFQQSAEGLADALVANGFTKFEARAEIETPKLPGFADLPMFAQDPTYRAPAERGEKFEIPQLALFVDGDLEPIEPEHFLDASWDLSKSDATLNEEEFPTEAKKPEDVELDITEQGRLKLSQVERRFVADLQTQLAMLATIDATTSAELVAWLDRHIPHPDITQDQMQNFLLKLVGHLTSKRGMTLEKLSRERLRLRAAAKQKIDTHRANVMKIGYQQMLFAPSAQAVRVVRECAFSYSPTQYAPNELYDGIHLGLLKKHFYRAIGAMNDEEARCAVALDKSPQVKYWVRNIERSPDYSFWLPTPTDKFYPDFIAQLNDGRTLVVEYKGAHLRDNKDTEQKQAIGELWAKRSKGKCQFLLVGTDDFETRLRAVA